LSFVAPLPERSEDARRRIGHLIPVANHKTPRRTLRAFTQFYTTSLHRTKRLVLSQKPAELAHLELVDQHAWEKYQTYLQRTSPLERAEFYQRQMKERGLRTAQAVAAVVGESGDMVRRHLRILELPETVRTYLRDNRTPENLRFFSLRELLKLVRVGDPKATTRRFRELLAEARGSVTGRRP